MSEDVPDSQVHEVTDVESPDLDVYRHLKDKHLRCRAGFFIAEGLEVVRRLLRSRFETHSLLVTPGKLRRLAADIPPRVPVYVASVEQMTEVAGFTIHRGAVACGVRPQPSDLDAVVAAAGATPVIVALENICDAQNVGVIIRNAAAFGAGLVVLSRCCDPFYRRAIRVSMGNCFNVPLYETDHLPEDLDRLRRRLGAGVLGAALAEDAVPLNRADLPRRAILVFGAEGAGLSTEVLAACDQRVIVPMNPDSDSVNVAVASGIFLYAFCALRGFLGSTASADSPSMGP